VGKVRDVAEALWTGEKSTVQLNPLTTFYGLEQITDGLAFVSAFANVVAVDTGEGLVLLDTGSFIMAQHMFRTVREWNDRPLHTAVYTHGHADHVFGVKPFEAESADKGWSAPEVIAHEMLPPRFDRYKATAGYNGAINARQFRQPGLKWPTEYRYPDRTFRDRLSLDIGGVQFELNHDRGETDDHVWIWIPDRKVVCTGDLFIWASPNCGNPQKVQRFPKEWAAALRKMAALQPETLLPGHGPPIFGADRVAQALDETATLLETVHDQTLSLMNEGKTLDTVLAEVEIPTELLERPYLRPVYDEPEFIVRNLWRLYGGWYDGSPPRLKPPRDRTIASEVCALAGGAGAVAERALAVADSGDLPLACQLAEWAWLAAPDDEAVKKARRQVYNRRADTESSLMARSIFMAAAEESK
jgi:alkyl sulfatase BDS1-like metallo-beta-lactamase superfamily hydrolase